MYRARGAQFFWTRVRIPIRVALFTQITRAANHWRNEVLSEDSLRRLKNFRGRTIRVKFHGLCQENCAASAGWAVISIVILGAHKRKGHGAKFVCPVSLAIGELSAILFVDDTDVIHLDICTEERDSLGGSCQPTGQRYELGQSAYGQWWCT